MTEADGSAVCRIGVVMSIVCVWPECQISELRLTKTLWMYSNPVYTWYMFYPMHHACDLNFFEIWSYLDLFVP